MFQVQNSNLNGSNCIKVHEKHVFHMITCGFLSEVINFAESEAFCILCVWLCQLCVVP